MIENYIDSTKELAKRELTFVRDAYNTYHLLDTVVSRVWLKKHSPDHPQVRGYFSRGIQPSIPIIMCTSLGLNGTEVNDLTPDDFGGV